MLIINDLWSIYVVVNNIKEVKLHSIFWLVLISTRFFFQCYLVFVALINLKELLTDFGSFKQTETHFLQTSHF